jgi:phospholipid/cholesterol/gamma-HCH transport system ATP-binding protein
VIALESVRKRYAADALDGVSLRIPGGCLYGLVGPGGSGKSVLLRHVAGLVAPDLGRVEVEGVDLGTLDEVRLQGLRARIGMLFQNNALFDFMSVGENVAFPLRRLSDASEAEIADRVAERLARVALPGFEARVPASLSGGQKKRVGIARATITRAPVLLYDDPTAGLDPVTSQKIFELIRGEQRSLGATAVVVSSDLEGLLGIADRVGMLVRGRLVFDGTVAEMRASQFNVVRQFVRGETEGPL